MNWKLLQSDIAEAYIRCGQSELMANELAALAMSIAMRHLSRPVAQNPQTHNDIAAANAVAAASVFDGEAVA